MGNKVIAFTNEGAEGQPSLVRQAAFNAYFCKLDFSTEFISKPKGIREIFPLIFYLIRQKNSFFFVSMPSFSGFWLFFIPGLRVILDIRDGWSIAQEKGYGSSINEKPCKARATRIIERFIIRRSWITITCTNGLQEYLMSISGRDVLLIPNGVPDMDYDLAHSLVVKRRETNSDDLIFCCAGKFSEYGADKVKKLCKVIIDRYQSCGNIKIQLIGSDEEKNAWVQGFVSEASNNRAVVEFLPRMGRDKLYRVLSRADYGIVVLRDPGYEFGTKVYDYIALGLPVVNYFDEPNNFTNYFDACLDVSFNSNARRPEIRRGKLIERELNKRGFE
tara:strand:- start:1337 stop:2332 length:996 start_codon:yes stop_codon:yes gene_type:complete